jgi:hypothetical protein
MGVWIVLVLALLPIIFKGLDVAGKRPCHWCRADVRRDAKLCPSCGYDPRPRRAERQRPAPPGNPPPPVGYDRPFTPPRSPGTGPWL